MIDNCIKKYVKNETASDKRYVREMFEYMFKDYTKEKDIHITSMMAGLVGIKPCVKADFDFVNGKVLLIFPEKDFFSPKEQASLKDLFPNATIEYIKNGHFGTVLEYEKYIRLISKMI